MSKLKRAAVASVFALGVTAATITPASAAGTGTYNCSGYGSSITGTFTRIAPTTIQLDVNVGYSSPTPILPGKFVAKLTNPAAPPYPVTLTNPNVLGPAGTSVRLTGTAPASPLLPNAPATINLEITPLGMIMTPVTCTFVSQGWPTWGV